MPETEAKLMVGRTPASDQGINFRQDQLVRVRGAVTGLRG